MISYIDTMANLNKKHIKTLNSIFEIPVRSNVLWTDVEKLLLALGSEMSEGRGSRIRIFLNGVRAVFHLSHPQKEIDKGALKSIRKFLEEAEVKNVKI